MPCRSGQDQRPLQQEPGPLELGGHVGDLPLQALELGQRLGAHLALAHVRHGVLERPLGGAQAHGRVAAALVVDVGEQGLEPAVVGGVAGDEDVVGLDAHAVEGELGLGAAPQAHLAVGAGHAHARRAARSTRTAPMPLPVPASLPGNRHHTRQATARWPPVT